jgi:hypothetical protein
MAFQIIWLCVSYGLVFAIAAALRDGGYLAAAIVVAVLFPAVRIASRWRKGEGYYRIGYIGRVGGEMRTPSGPIRRADSPQLFQLMMVVELVIVALLAISVFA